MKVPSWLALGVAAALAAVAMGASRDARADEGVKATFALIMGSNLSVDRDLPPLKYADDDAASYLDLFRVLGAHTYLLSRLDDNTRRLHAQAAAEALEPTRATLEQTVAQIASDVTRARDRQVETVLYIVYAGHGNVRDGVGYVTLEDMRITGSDLAKIAAAIPATRVHIIVDACASYYLAYSRGPGGERRPLSGFQDSSQLASDPLGAIGVSVGAVLSVSAATVARDTSAEQSQADVEARNRRISAFDTGAVIGYLAGGVSMATGVALLLWPGGQHVQAAGSRSGGYVGYQIAF